MIEGWIKILVINGPFNLLKKEWNWKSNSNILRVTRIILCILSTFRDKIWDIKVRKKWCKKIEIAAAAQRNHHRRWWWWHWEKSYELQIFVMEDDPQTSQHGIRALWPRNLSKFDEIFKYLPNKNEWRKCMGPSINDVTHFMRFSTPPFHLSPILLDRLMEKHHLLADPPSP